jgi:glutaminase
LACRLLYTAELNDPANPMVRPDNLSNEAEFSPILSSLKDIHAKYRQNTGGKIATYIPELAKADPNLFGIALVTADGQL